MNKVSQSQASLTCQLRELIQLANEAGLYDAADYITRDLEKGGLVGTLLREYDNIHFKMDKAKEKEKPSR